MNNFKKINEQEFFIVIDAPLYNTQCHMLGQLLPDYVWNVSHDYYGSFIVELQEGVEQTDRLYEEIWAAGEDLFFALHQSQTYDEFLPEADSVGEAWDWLASVLESAGYTDDVDSIAEKLVDCDFNPTEVEKHATFNRLKEEA